MVAATTGTAFAQAGGTLGNVSGQVLNDAGAPVPNVTVSLASPAGNYLQKTDAQGRFHFLNVAADTYTIAVEAAGFQTYSQQGVTITGGANVNLGSVRLQRQLQTIGRAVARSQSSAFQPNQTIPQYTVSGAVLQAAQGKAASSNENAALVAIPGFQRDSTGNIILEGSTTDEIHYQFDGVDFTDPGFSRSINQNFLNGISTIQAVPGAGDPSQGNSGAGVVNLVVKRGTYPGTGLLDLEAQTQPYANQVNFQYGIASPNGRISDFISEFGSAFNYQIGPYPAGNSFNQGIYTGTYGNKNENTNDFINNFVYRFGRENAQSFQVLYYSHADNYYTDPNGTPLYYENNAPDFLAADQSAAGTFPGDSTNPLPISVIQNLKAFAPGQTSLTQTVNQRAYTATSTSLLKFEYDNQLNTTTSLNLRFFHSDNYAFGPAAGTQTQFEDVTATTQTEGGSRTGANFALTKQADPHNLLTLSGTYELNKPNFGSLGPTVGFDSLGPNVQDFLTPAAYGTPVGPGNPCPYNYSAAAPGCYLYSALLAAGKLPATAAAFPKVPPLTLRSYEIQNEYGLGLRDQVTVTNNFNLDLGVRYDLINNGYGAPGTLYHQDVNTQPVPGAPAVFNIADYPFVEQPHFIEPRLGFSFRPDRNNAVSFTYGRSINLNGSGELASPEDPAQYAQFAGIPVNPNYIPTSNPFTGQPSGLNGGVGPLNCYPNVPFPKGATATTPPSYNGTVAGANANLQLGRPCGDYGDLLYQAQDAYFPEITAVQPAVFDNFDVSLSHLFKNGSALRINPYNRQGYKIQAITAPLVDINGVLEFGSLTSTPLGKQETTGLNVEYTLPDRPSGFTGFLSASYINEFTNTPAAGDNPYAQDFEPVILPQSLAAGNIYRAGYVSPFTLTTGLVYKTRSGFRINPVLDFNVGYPYNDGLLTPYGYLGGYQNVPNTNFTDQYGASGAPQYVDPANPGTITKPNIAATRGTPNSLSNGGLLSRPQLTANLTLEYTKPHTRSTFGVQVINLFNNGIYTRPTPNLYYQPVVNGVAGPLTGQNPNAVGFENLIPVVANGTLPYSPYNVLPNTTASGANTIFPLTFRIYYQLGL